MAAPPPAYSTPHAGNPDRRALPDGWITRYDDNYRAWYYVDTRAHPPRSAWDHPLGPPPATPAGTYAPPPHPPPHRAGSYNTASSPSGSFPASPPQPSQPYSGQPYSPSSAYSGYSGTPHDQRAFQQQPQSTFPTQQQPYGSNYGNPGNPGWPQQGWPQQPPTQFGSGYPIQPPSQATQQPPRTGRNTGGVGLGTVALAGGAGLVGGALVANAFDDHEDRVREEGYDQGFGDGQDNADFGGDVGGDW